MVAGTMDSSVKLDTWEKVARFSDEHLVIKPSYLDRVNKRKYPVDAFSLGQLASKAWLLAHLMAVAPRSAQTAALLGCWIGSMVPMLHQNHSIGRVYGIDVDPHSIALAEEFNQELVNDNWRFKGVVADIDLLDCADMQFQTGGELIECKPDWVINTSCEHMSTHWFETVDTDQLIIMQTNNSPDFEGHINTCDSVSDMQTKYPLSNVLYAGELITPAYTRYMQIGYR